MRLLLCLSCLLGFASLPTVKTSTSPATPVNPSATIPSVKPVSLPTVTQGPTTGGAVTKPSSGTSAGVETLKPSTTASVVAVLSNNAPTTPSSPQVLPTSGSATVITTSSSGPQVITGTVATVSKPTESTSKFGSPAAAATLSASTAAALNPSSSTNRATLGTSTPDGSKQSAVHTQQSTTSAGSNTPGSSLTVQSITSALPPVPAGPHSTAGPTLSQETSEPTPKNVVIDPASEATSTVSGRTRPVLPPEKPGSTLSAASVSSTPAKIIWTSTLPGDQPKVSSTASTSQTPGPIPSGGIKTMNFPGIELTCFLQEFPNQSLIIQTQGNKPTLCKDETVKHEKELLAVLCETVNQGFKFNENKDNCTVKLAHSTDQPHKFAVLAVSVKANAAAEDMDKVLKGRSEELKKLGFLLDKSGIESLETYEDKISIPLIITIVSLAAALLLIAAIYSCCHQGRRHRKDQRLTEELQTMENGYHDNPTLEVMETSPEMQEKKPGLNGDLGDSWIVPMDNLMKEDMDDEEEDTHL